MKYCFLLLLFVITPFTLPAQRPVFPLKVADTKRYLVDAAGKPFLFQADAAWQVFMKGSRADIIEFMVRRKAQGFNALQVQLSGRPSDVDIDGNRPFLREADLATPNEPYFARVEWCLRQADSLGLLIVMAPLWKECCQGGWGGPGRALEQNGAKKSRQFAEYLGKRFAKFNNLMWILGGDNDPHTDWEHYMEMGMGLLDTAPHQLRTYHASTTHSSTDFYANVAWLDFSMVYTYFKGMPDIWLKPEAVPEVWEECYEEWNRKLKIPYLLGEAEYEGYLPPKEGAFQARKNAWWTMLAGGMGHCYGSPNHLLPENWREINELIAANQMRYVREFLEPLPWWTLVPDQPHQWVTAGYGAGATYVTTAFAGDGTLALSYLPVQQKITVNLTRFNSPIIKAYWLNPRNGTRTGAGNFTNKGQRSFTPPGTGLPNEDDWLLLLDGRQ